MARVGGDKRELLGSDFVVEDTSVLGLSIN